MTFGSSDLEERVTGVVVPCDHGPASPRSRSATDTYCRSFLGERSGQQFRKCRGVCVEGDVGIRSLDSVGPGVQHSASHR